MKLTSWGYCVLVYDSARVPAACPDDAFAVVPGCSGSEFEVSGLAMTYPVLKKDLPWVVHQVCDKTPYCFGYVRDS